MPDSRSDLDALGAELVTRYRQAVSRASGEDAASAALLVSRALEAIQRAKLSLHAENAYETAIADITDARNAVTRLSTSVEGP